MNNVSVIQTRLSIWQQWPAEDARFVRLVKICLSTLLLIGVVIPWLTVTQPPPLEPVKVPERIARMILEKQLPVAPPRVAPAKVEKKPVPEPESQSEPRPEPRPEPGKPPKAEEKKPVPQAAKKTPQPKPTTREKVSKVGLLALSQELADIQNMAPVTRQQRVLQRASTARSARPKAADTASLGQTSRGVQHDTGKISQRNTRLAQRQLSQVEVSEPVAAQVAKEGLPGPRMRTEADVSMVLARSKASFDILYNRQLRREPGIRGRVLFEIRIAPSGRVIACRILETELGSPALERRLVLKIKSLDFGAQDVDTTIINYPLEFSPA